MQELRTVQALRALACALVVVYHTLLASSPALASTWPNGSAGVDLFFVISGFVMVTSARRLNGRPDPARRFLRRRLLRIAPLYWLLTALKLGAALTAPSLATHTRPDLWNVCASFLFLPARDAAGEIRPVLPVGWTLNFEMLFYALFAAALAGRRRPLPILAPILALLAFVGLFRTPSWPAPLALANGLVLEFAFGMAIAEALRRRKPLPPRIGAVCAVVGCALLVTLPLAGPFRCLVWGGPAALILLGALALEPHLGTRIPEALVAAGDASYATYLTHPFVIPALAALSPAALLAALPASLAAGAWVDRRIDRPLRQALGGASASQAANWAMARARWLVACFRAGSISP